MGKRQRENGRDAREERVMSKKGNERIEIETSTRENTERMRRTGEQNNNKRERG